MRNCSVVFFIVCFICTHSYSQDLIVTNVGDSISCKIIRQTATIIHYSYFKYNITTVKELSRKKIRSVIPGYYRDKQNLQEPAGEVQPDSLAGNPVEILLTAGDSFSLSDPAGIGQSRWQIGINGGYSYRLFRPLISATAYEARYIEKIKSGYSIGADVFYFPWKRVGFGLKYDIYRSTGERDIRTKDNITIQFAGASVAYRMGIVDHKTSLLTAFWAGYQPYKNIATHIGQEYTLRAKTMGWGISVGIDRAISRAVALSLSGSCFISSAYKLQRDHKGRTETVNLAREKFEDLSRAQITLGVKLLK